ncbi:hypothetical protein, variant 1 [Puccinia triticina 1-1 BBBD Race 1]|uniref:CCHC-type domain-containing protein n=1 Tax=Puccinia triticina (isolate 1-1 / race 1 (BBBD)) TaxID=630390 RepID=A0A180GBI8_PUCT1|nr:hypothetical protein PTTG_28423 [Puccinia triticina 1-1 BBBD Race 1]OAV90107.1 hypothetical protein, variant 1 [Puccinia triticina 1-1 BBBD Race 1]
MMSRRNSVNSHASGREEEEFVPDGGARMASLFDLFTGGNSGRGGDETIRPLNNPTGAQPGGSATGHLNVQNRGAPPHIPPPQQGAAGARPGNVVNDLSRAHQDFLAARLQLEQAKLVSQTAKLINDWWTDGKRLAANGANLTQWLKELEEIGRSNMSDGDFFTQPIQNTTFEKIARMVVLEGVHPSLVPDLQRAKSALEMLSILKKRFLVVSRAAQMNVWNRFLDFSVNDAEGAGLSSTMRNLYTEWNNLNVRIHSDAFFGFVFQQAVMQSLVAFKNDFLQWVKTSMQHDESKSTPKFDFLVNTFDICKKQNADSKSEETLADSSAPSVLLAEGGEEEVNFDALLADVPEENWPDVLDFYATTAHWCWQCGAADHYLSECPQRVKPNQINKKLRGPGVSPFPMPAHRTQATFVGSLYTQPTSAQSPNQSTP